MIFINSKTIWGFVEKNSIRVVGYRVFIQNNADTIETTTNLNGFYQINLESGYFDPDTLVIEASDNVSFYGNASLLLTSSGATQQVPTIAVTADTASPQLLSITPTGYTKEPIPQIQIDLIDSASGVNPDSLDISYNSVAVVTAGAVVSPTVTMSLVTVGTQRLKVTLQPTAPLLEGSTVNIAGSVRDKIGNVVSFTTNFRIDLSPPAAVLISPLPNSFVQDVNTAISIDVSDSISGVDTSSIRFIVNDVLYTISSPELTYSNNVLTFTPSTPFGNTSVVSWSFELDDIAGNHLPDPAGSFAVFAVGPKFINLGPSPNTFINSRRPIIFFQIQAGSAPVNLSSFVMTLDLTTIGPSDPRLTLSTTGGSFLPDFDLPDQVNVKLTISDTLGLTTEQAWVFLVDIAVPTILPITPVSNGYVSSLRSALRFNITDPQSGINPITISALINSDIHYVGDPGVSFVADSLLIIPTTDYLDVGANSVLVQAKDYAGNAAIPLYLQFSVDGDAPHIDDISPARSSTTNDLQPPITISITDDLSGINASTIVVTVNDRTYQAGSANFSFDGTTITVLPILPFALTETVIVSLRVADNVGNILDTVATSFSFDVSLLEVVDIKPVDGQYLSQGPRTIVVRFNKPIDISSAILDLDIRLESEDLTAVSPSFVPFPLDSVTGIDPLNHTKLNIVTSSLSANQAYRVSLTNNIFDLSGNKLGNPSNPAGTTVFQSTFIVYQPGDTLMRGTVSIVDLLKYEKIIEGCCSTIVSPIPELADLNGDGTVDFADITTLESLILGEIPLSAIHSLGSRPVNNLPVPSINGSIGSIQLGGFSSIPVGGVTAGTVSFVSAINIVAFQADIIFDPHVLYLIDITPALDPEIFQYREIVPGQIRFLLIKLDGSLSNTLLNIKFRVIGNPGSSISLSGIQIVTTGEAILPASSNTALFITDSIAPLITSIQATPSHILVPSSGRETLITAQLLGPMGDPALAEAIFLDWSVIGSGFVSNPATQTNRAGTSINILRMTGPVGSTVRVAVQARYDASISGLSPVITLFDGQAVSLIISPGSADIGTGEPLQLTALVTTIDGTVFPTTDVTWSTTSPEAVVNPSGEFVAFSAGTYRVDAVLNTDPGIVGRTGLIIVTSVFEIFDCDDNPLKIDDMTGLAKLSLGNVFAGRDTGTQEIHITNVLASHEYPMLDDILLDLDAEPVRSNLQTEFYPIVHNSISLFKRRETGETQIITLASGSYEQKFPSLTLSMADTNGVVTLTLDHVNIHDFGLFNCGINVCIGQKTRAVFIEEKNAKSLLVDDGDFYVDKKLGLVYLLITSDAETPGRICYSFDVSATLNEKSGEVNLVDTGSLAAHEIVLASYQFLSGTLEDINISVVDSQGSDVTISLDGVTFEKTVSLTRLLPHDFARLYVKANATDMIGLQAASLAIEADLITVKSC